MRFVRINAALLTLAALNPLQAGAWSPQDPPASSAGDELRIHAAPPAIVPEPVRSAADAFRRIRRALSSNDLILFRSLLTAARSFADGMPIGGERNTLRRLLLISADLETVWSYASSQSFGSFYDDESLAGVHDHLSADYPGYAPFIDQYRVIDRDGRILYPTAETRAFLLQKLNTLSFPPAASARPKTPASPAATAGRTTHSAPPIPRARSARPASRATTVGTKKRSPTSPPHAQPKRGKHAVAKPPVRSVKKTLPPKS